MYFTKNKLEDTNALTNNILIMLNLKNYIYKNTTACSLKNLKNYTHKYAYIQTCLLNFWSNEAYCLASYVAKKCQMRRIFGGPP